MIRRNFAALLLAPADDAQDALKRHEALKQNAAELKPTNPADPSLPGTIPVLTVSGAADAKANSLQSNSLQSVSSVSLFVHGALLITFCSRSKSAVTVS